MSSTESYAAFFSTLGDKAPMAMLSLFFLGMARLAPIVAFAPFFGSKLPAPVKMGLILTTTLIMLPHLVVVSKTVPDFNAFYIVCLLKEVLIGYIIVLMISVPFYIALSSGSLIDFLRGTSSLQVTDPTSQEQTSSLGILYNYLLIVIFYNLDGPILFFNSLMQSYTLLPVDSLLSPLFFSDKLPLWPLIFASVAKVMALAIQLSAPCLLAILMTEVFLGIANRLAPQVQITFLGMSLKSLIGLAVLALAWTFILKQMSQETFLWMKEVDKALFSMSKT